MTGIKIAYLRIVGTLNRRFRDTEVLDQFLKKIGISIVKLLARSVYSLNFWVIATPTPQHAKF